MARKKDTVAEQTRKAKEAAKKLHSEAEHAEKAADKLLGAAGGRVADFMNFVREQGVVGLAVGLAIGAQTNATVKSIVEGLINPIVGFILGSDTALADQKWYLIGQDTEGVGQDAESVDYLLTLGNRQLVFGWGEILSSLIQLVAVAAVIYFVVKGLGFDKLDKKKQ